MAHREKKVSEFPEQDVRTIRDIHHHWLSEERRGNPVAVLQWCTDDVRWIPPDSPVLAGKEAIRKWLESNKMEIKSLESTNLQITGSGSVAYKTGDYSTTFVDPNNSEIYRVSGTHLWGRDFTNCRAGNGASLWWPGTQSRSLRKQPSVV